MSLGKDHPNAHDDGVRRLYRYVSYPPSSEASQEATEIRRRADALITRGELYFATAQQMNDPFEASPKFAIPRTATGRPDYDALVATLRRVYAPKWRWPEERISVAETELRTKIENGTFEADMQLVVSKWGREFRTQYPMCCFAKTDNDIPMWAYYASAHAGACIHFDATVAPVGNSLRVNYSDAYPELPVPLGGLDPQEIIVLALLTKSNAWLHEGEYRLINIPTYGEGTQITGHVLDGLFAWPSGPQLAIVPRRYVTGMTVGAQMEGTFIEHFARLCRDRKPSISLYQARLHPSRFALEFDPVK